MCSWTTLVAERKPVSDSKTRPLTASFLLVSAVCVALWLSTGCAPGAREFVLEGQTMGTTYHIKMVVEQGELPRGIQAQVDAALNAVDMSMSTYKPESELNRLNRHPVGESFAVSADLWAVLDIAAQIYGLTDGAFDPSVAPLVNLWGFGPVETGDRIPADGEIEALVAAIGFDKLVRSETQRTVYKSAPLSLDLSAVAKGYGADKVARLLRSQGIHRYMIEVGGELALAGLNSRGQAWRIAIETPALFQGEVQKIIAVTDRGLATSGDYRNYFEKDGKRYSHTIDPRTGRPITHRLASVTVIADTAAMADALATGFDVLGAERALVIAGQLNVPVFLVVREAGGFKEIYSEAFAPYLDADAEQEK